MSTEELRQSVQPSNLAVVRQGQKACIRQGSHRTDMYNYRRHMQQAEGTEWHKDMFARYIHEGNVSRYNVERKESKGGRYSSMGQGLNRKQAQAYKGCSVKNI
jgi:hypothetical protein